MKPDLYDKLVDYIMDNQNQFYRLAFSYVKNQEDALDAVQNAVCRALEKYRSLRNEKAMKAWLYRIVVNESLRVLKDKKRMRVSMDEEFPELSYEEKGFEAWDDLWNLMEQLEWDTQTIIRLRFFEELSLEEIADILEMNLNTVKSKLYRGLKDLRQRVKEDGL